MMDTDSDDAIWIDPGTGKDDQGDSGWWQVLDGVWRRLTDPLAGTGGS